MGSASRSVLCSRRKNFNFIIDIRKLSEEQRHEALFARDTLEIIHDPIVNCSFSRYNGLQWPPNIKQMLLILVIAFNETVFFSTLLQSYSALTKRESSSEEEIRTESIN